MSRSTAAIFNTVARGAAQDIDATGSTVPCTVQASNYRAGSCRVSPVSPPSTAPRSSPTR
jgi:hypothetical protein